jgi:hypothetical protein
MMLVPEFNSWKPVARYSAFLYIPKLILSSGTTVQEGFPAHHSVAQKY